MVLLYKAHNKSDSRIAKRIHGFCIAIGGLARILHVMKPDVDIFVFISPIFRGGGGQKGHEVPHLLND